ncbi:hypothetical protein B0I35DRAFT_398061 [Stachybotrys elegans]|uniref:Zn(2)-C6 fungal-type domain-containing protein n=1 Tax=Stachybotrys elegans TaxID=80388 RepID=A0A8K0SJT9_9HYPO|nr:hypothetical protein B0I35DRAFT_398061 [Stachybotrys elegans]
MPLGPFDKRRKQSRCEFCSKTHRKCTGLQPCSECLKRALPCSYADKKATGRDVIRIDAGIHSNAADFASWRPRHPAGNPSPVGQPALPYGSLLVLFDRFAARNNFIGKGRNAFASQLKAVSSLSSHPYVLDAILAIGAIQGTKEMPIDDKRRQRFQFCAIHYYTEAVAKMGRQLAVVPKVTIGSEKESFIWTTMLLGLFELAAETTSDGWVKHMVHGTSRALESAGMSLHDTKSGRALFSHVRLFEVCRTILFNESTFLTRPEWISLSKVAWTSDSTAERCCLGDILDIMVASSALRTRASKMVSSDLTQLTIHDILAAQDIAQAGFDIRQMLFRWHIAYAELEPDDHSDDDANTITSQSANENALLSQLFHAAVSIYLSGVFDYETSFWSYLDIPTPILEEATINGYVQQLLDLSTAGLDNSSLSPLLFLIPLRIAGARARNKLDCEQIGRLLGKIRRTFAIASAIQSDLEHVWWRKGLLDMDFEFV